MENYTKTYEQKLSADSLVRFSLWADSAAPTNGEFDMHT